MKIEEYVFKKRTKAIFSRLYLRTVRRCRLGRASRNRLQRCFITVGLICLFMETSVFRMEASCLELALEGERLCKAGDFKGGTAFFEAAVQVGTEDLKTLSAIYSQLGNAYFYLKEYGKALEYHRHDLTLARWVSNCEKSGAFETVVGGYLARSNLSPPL